MPDRSCICIDLKSFYASVECVARGLDPLKARLLVADASRTDKTICLAVSPALKAIGVSSRPRLFEAKQAIRLYEAAAHTHVDYITATPRMAEYIRVSSEIYAVYRKYIAEEDIHVYSIDECFLDVTPYLHLYKDEATAENISPARFLAMAMVRDSPQRSGSAPTCTWPRLPWISWPKNPFRTRTASASPSWMRRITGRCSGPTAR